MNGNLGGYIGAAIGCLAWMIGFTVVCFLSGNADVWTHWTGRGPSVSGTTACVLVLS